MYVTKFAVCLAALLWILELPAIAASAAMVAIISAALELAALRVAQTGNPVAAAPASAPEPRSARARATAKHEGAQAFVAAAPGASAATPRLLDAHSLDDEMALDDTPIDTRATTARPVEGPPALATGPALAVASVALAPGMLDMPAASHASVVASSSDSQATQQQYVGAFDAGATPTATSISSMAAAMAEDGWASEPVGGY